MHNRGLTGQTHSPSGKPIHLFRCPPLPTALGVALLLASACGGRGTGAADHADGADGAVDGTAPYADPADASTSGTVDAPQAGRDALGPDGPWANLMAYCTARQMAGACDDDKCAFGCCGGSDHDWTGCAGCCNPRPCQAIPPAGCPADVCQLLTNCSGAPTCYPLFNGPPPACGPIGYYGQDVECCAGLVKRCGLRGGEGACHLDAGGYNDLPTCLACGDGVCDTLENSCSCPEDCP